MKRFLICALALSASLAIVGCKTTTVTSPDGTTTHTSEVWTPTAEQAAIIEQLISAGVSTAGDCLALYQQFAAAHNSGASASTNSAAASAACQGGGCAEAKLAYIAGRLAARRR